jgi:hypothetical protein
MSRFITFPRKSPEPARANQHAAGIATAPPREAVERIEIERQAKRTLAAIAEGLNADGVPTAHGGRKWWPETVRGVLRQTWGLTRLSELLNLEIASPCVIAADHEPGALSFRLLVMGDGRGGRHPVGVVVAPITVEEHDDQVIERVAGQCLAKIEVVGWTALGMTAGDAEPAAVVAPEVVGGAGRS